MQNVAIILRGVSGCGKSKLAQYLCWLNSGDFLDNYDYGTVVCTADDYHIVNGEYLWKPEKAGYAHNSCFEKFKKAVEEKVSLVILANTSTQEYEFQKYIDYAEQNNYTVFSLIVENRHEGKDSHNVPEETLQRQEDNLKGNLKLR